MGDMMSIHYSGIAAVSILLGCAGSKGPKPFNHCDDMEKTNVEIRDLEARNKELNEKAKTADQAGVSGAEDGKAYRETMAKNDDKIKYLKEYNLKNAENCRPTWHDPDAKPEKDLPGHR
jgi:hypothetical protein